jgi:hypothetical protein
MAKKGVAYNSVCYLKYGLSKQKSVRLPTLNETVKIVRHPNTKATYFVFETYLPEAKTLA